MHALCILQQRLRRACPQIHLKRLTALVDCVAGAMRGQRLTLTAMGCALPSPARTKHRIKRVDRLLGNVHLASERPGIYQAVARGLLTGMPRPVIVVDWSDLTSDRRWQLLRAAIPMSGRTLTLYEQVHPLRHFANQRVHRAFLRKLKLLLPPHATPILVTDAGFRVPWFKAVSQFGWHWIGRVRNRDYVRAEDAQTWIGCKNLYAGATTRPQALGTYDLVRSNPIRAAFYLVKRSNKHRVNKSVFGQRVRINQSLKQARGQREPWLLAVSPSLATMSATDIVNCYAQRMQIDEAFRDLKSDRYGLGFELHLSRSRERIATLLLIASLALLMLWQIGSAALARKLHLRYQSNTRKARPALLVINLARLIVRDLSYSSPPRDRRLHNSPTRETAFNIV